MKQNRLKVKIASYLILLKENKILMTRRFNTGWSDGMYSLPSGPVSYTHLDVYKRQSLPFGI